MPLVVAAASTPPPVIEPTTPTRQPKRVIWTDPAGRDFDLSTDGYSQLTGRFGFGVVEREVIVDRMPSGAGMLHAIRDTPRVLSMPLLISGTTTEEYLRRRRDLQEAFRHRRGGVDVPGRITVALPNGQRRSIAAYYHGGLDGEESFRDDLILRRQPFPELEFIALDPYWESEAIEIEWKQAEAGAFFPILPVNLAPSQVLGDTTADNIGDAPAYPVWEIDGPGTPTVRNVTTGQEWAFTVSIPTGRTVTVDTRPPEIAPETGLTAVDDLGEDYWPNFADFPQLWALEPGTNDLSLEVTAATVDTAVRMTATIRHQAGW